MVRSRSHFHALPFADIDVILGINGYCWIFKRPPYLPDETPPEKLYSNENEPISPLEREVIARVGNLISVLASRLIPIGFNALLEAYDVSLQWPAVKQLLLPETADVLVTETLQRLEQNKVK